MKQERWISGRCVLTGKELSVLMLDLDHFKAVNDSFGHDAGDKVLEALGALLKKSFRSADKVCRYGGEEFLVVLKGTGPRDSLRIAEELRQKIAVMDFPDYRELNISARSGRCPSYRRGYRPERCDPESRQSPLLRQGRGTELR